MEKQAISMAEPKKLVNQFTSQVRGYRVNSGTDHHRLGDTSASSAFRKPGVQDSTRCMSNESRAIGCQLAGKRASPALTSLWHSPWGSVIKRA